MKRHFTLLSTLTLGLTLSIASSFAVIPPKANPQMQRVLDVQKSLGGHPLETLTPAEARKLPGVGDAAKLILKKEGKSTAPLAGISVKEVSFDGPGGALPARIYTPDGIEGPLPVIVYYHGGGWVIADTLAYDASARALAKETKAIVVSAEYRKAPEHPFPASHEDAFAAYKWAWENAKSFNGDPTRIAVAGESAGGNLAANVSLMALTRSIPVPVHQLLIYPVVGTDMSTPSYKQNANAKPLNEAMMKWFVKYELPTAADKKSPKVNLLTADLKGMPPTTIITAQIDPLRSEGEMLGKKLKEAGVPVSMKNYPGVTHEFFGLGSVVDEAKQAEAYAAQQLSNAFEKTPPGAEASAKQAVPAKEAGTFSPDSMQNTRQTEGKATPDTAPETQVDPN
jgi:acetyl esterase